MGGRGAVVAKLLGKLSVPGRPTNLDNSRTKTCLHILSFVYLSLFFLPLWETVRYRLKYRLKGPDNLASDQNLQCLLTRFSIKNRIKATK